MFIDIDKLIKLVKALTSARFHGRIILSFEAGNIVHIKKEETLKAADLN